MDFDVATPRCGHFELDGVERDRGQPETQTPLETVIRTTGEHYRPGAYGSLTRLDLDPLVSRHHVTHAHAKAEHGASMHRGQRQGAIQLAAIDDDRFSAGSGVRDLVTAWRDKAGGRKLVENACPRQRELIEGIGGKHAGAMDWPTDLLVFLEDFGR